MRNITVWVEEGTGRTVVCVNDKELEMSLDDAVKLRDTLTHVFASDMLGKMLSD